MFHQALRIRRVEEVLADLYPSDQIQSPIHLSIGQEHISVAVCSQLERSDLVFGSYRGHALYLAKGGSLKKMVAELFGKSTGCSGGRGGSMHLCAKEVGMMGASAVVASTIPHAVGSAIAAKIRNTNQVVCCFYGEGATGEGVYHESLNHASIYGAPILFICENNNLSINSKSSDLQSYDITSHAGAYGLECRKIENGWDMSVISEVSENAIDTIRKVGRPYLLEIETHRDRQHVGPNEDYDIGYRERSELEKWQQRDPLVQDTERITKYLPSIEREIDEAIQYATDSPFPTTDELHLNLI